MTPSYQLSLRTNNERHMLASNLVESKVDSLAKLIVWHIGNAQKNRTVDLNKNNKIYNREYEQY